MVFVRAYERMNGRAAAMRDTLSGSEEGQFQAAEFERHYTPVPGLTARLAFTTRNWLTTMPGRPSSRP